VTFPLARTICSCLALSATLPTIDAETNPMRETNVRIGTFIEEADKENTNK
jgi:hypothetical protein